MRFLELFAAGIRNPHTHRAYSQGAAAEEYLHAYLDGAGIAGDSKEPLFRTISGKTKQLITTTRPQASVYAMIQRCTAALGLGMKIGNHTFRTTGITTYLKNGGALKDAAAMANHANTRTT